MTYRQAEEHLLGLEMFGMRFGLDRMHKLMTALGMPQRSFASIHVVGTNGKSSTVRFVAALLERRGLRTGSYTSPHLRGFAERVEVGGRQVAEADFAAAVARVAHAAELVQRTADEPVTQFEALTAAAYHQLATQDVEVAVIEAGLGGRFDATNVIPSSVQVLTGVGLEHTRWLGPTVKDIAEEKLAIVPSLGCLVTAPDLAPEAAAVAAQMGAERVIAEPDPGVELRARGGFQRRNFALAVAAAGAFLRRAGLEPLTAAEVLGAAQATEIPGRLQVVAENPLTLYDGAHNPAGARALAEALPEVSGGKPLTAVLSVLDDKDAAAMLAELAPVVERAVFTRCANPRALSPATLESLWARISDAPAETVADPLQALRHARELAGPDGAVLATGSIYLVADLVRDRSQARASTL